MRITVGHVLILAGVGGIGWMHFSSQQLDTRIFFEKYAKWTGDLSSMVDSFRSGSKTDVPATPVQTQAEPPMSTTSVDEIRPVMDTQEVSAAEPKVAEVVAPVEQKPEVKAVPRKAEAPKIRKSRKAKAKINKDPLVGTMVALTLDSGRQIRGILEERTASSYKIQLPGMGPFTYDAAKVKAISSAK